MRNPAPAKPRASAQPARTPGSVLESLLKPLSVQAFFRGHWEKSACLVARRGAEDYSHLLRIADVDALISLTSDPSKQRVRLVRTNGADLAEKALDTHGDGSVDVFSVYRAYHEGYTAIVNSVDTRWTPIAALCRGLEETLGYRVGANLYLTPAGAQGFLPHFDTHDVFILQLEGRKRWRIYGAPTPLALESEAKPVERKSIGAPRLEFVLEPGDLLYIPRGQIHEAATSEQSSAHLTVGIYPRRWMDVMIDVIREAAEGDIEMRRGVLPRGLAAGPHKTGAHLSALFRKIAASALDGRTLSRHTGRPMETANPAPDGHFASLDRVSRIQLDTAVARRPGMSCAVVVRDREAVIRFRGNSVSGPAAIAPALRFVAASPAFSVAELPDCLATKSKLVLVKRLVREGLLSIPTRPREADRG